MRNHLIIWSVALVVGAAALALWFSRQAAMRPDSVPMTPAELVQRAMLELDNDPSAADVWTQSVLRAAAVEVEAGRITSAEGDFILAMQYQRERNLAASEALFKRAIGRRPDWSRAYAGLANLLGRHTYGRLDEAEHEIRKAIELEPGWGRGYDILAVILRLSGRLKEAEVPAKKAIALDPSDAAHYNNYANLLLEMKRLRDAEAQFRLAINVDPENPKPFYNLAALYVRQGRQRNAVDTLRDAIERAPNLREEASADPDFDLLRGRADFDKLVSPPAEPVAATKVDPKPKAIKKKPAK